MNEQIENQTIQPNSPKKIIFLDFDGVLNHERWYVDRQAEKNDGFTVGHPYSEFDPKSIEYLNDLIQETGAKVVVSSTWRLGRHRNDLQEILNKRGFTGEIIGITPNLRNLGESILRGNEILQWIKDNKEIVGCPYYEYENYVILDDDSDMLYWQKDNFILVDRFVGITPGTTFKAKKILNGKRH
jgi:hypothetical protein